MIQPKYERVHQEFPGLPAAALDFFHISNVPTAGQQATPRSVLDFAGHIAKPGDFPNTSLVPTMRYLSAILERMAALNLLTVVRRGNQPELGDSAYLCTLVEPLLTSIRSTLDFIVYGFPVIYQELRGAVVPLIHGTENGDERVGTAFLAKENVLITASHCISGASALSIRGISEAQFADAKIALASNAGLDVAAIKFSGPVLNGQRPIELGMGEVLQDVLVMGYPNVPTFASMLAAEKAMISGRLTATRGAITSQPKEIFARVGLFLITARVRGGFSGGPVINEAGVAVGMISREPIGDNSDQANVFTRYDNLGYGVAIPSEEIVKFLAGCSKRDPAVATFVQNGGPRYRPFQESILV